MASLQKLVRALALLIAIGLLAAAPADAAQDNLFDASAAGDLSQVKALLAAAADVNAKRANGATALMIASEKGHMDVVQALLAARADVNVKGGAGVTALMIASQNGHLEVVRALLAAKADVNARTADGGTALMIASQQGHLEVVGALLAARADVNAKAGNGLTALMVASQQGHLEVARALLAAKADVNTKAANGVTALIVGSENGRLEVVRALLAAKADVNAKMDNGLTALMISSQNGHLEVARALRAAEPGLVDENLITPVPHGWKVAFHGRQGNIQAMQFVPNSDSAEKWSEAIFVTTYFGLTGATAVQLMAVKEKQLSDQCDGIHTNKVAAGEENGYEFAVEVISCDKMKADGLRSIMMWKFVRSRDSSYSVERIIKGVPAALRVQSSIDDWKPYMRRVVACDTRDAARPCSLGDASLEPQSQEWRWCRVGAEIPPDLVIADCTTVIQSSRDTNPDLASPFRNRGIAYAAKAQYDRAIEDLDQAIRLDPKDAPAFNDRGNAYKAKAQDDRAIEDYDQAIRLDPTLARAFYNRGNAYQGKVQYDRAIEDYDQAIRLDPKYAPAFYNRGSAYAAKAQYDRAIEDFDQAIRLDPKFAPAFYNRGNAYAAQAQYDRAIEDFGQAIRLDPKFAAAFRNRGTAYVAKAQYDRAIEDLDQAIRLDPKDAAAFLNRGIAYFGIARFAVAAGDFQQSLSINAEQAYGVLWLHLARARSNHDDTEELTGNASKVDLNTWPGPVVAFYLKRIDAKDVMGAAQSGDAKTQREQGCEASFYVGEDAVLRQHTDEATRLLRQAQGTCPPSFTEYAATLAELKRLEK